MKIAFYTLGCKVNQYETQVLSRLFASEGYDIVKPDEIADVYVLNSCTVTAEGDRKTRQLLNRFKTQNLNAKIVLTGCFPQAFPDIAEKLQDVDIIAGNRNRANLVELVAENLRTNSKIIKIIPHERNEPFESGDAGDESHTRAFLKIEDGCERYCAYCIIPTARGFVRSMPPEEIVERLQGLAQAGYQEAVLTGINLSCYGKDLGLRLADAVEAACSTNMMRIRLGSLEPELLESEDITRLAAQNKLCPQFHMALQSGCDATLKRMNRHYTSAEFANIIREIRAKFKDPSITTDIMVGFPGETGEEFAESLAFAQKLWFAKVHIFAYSLRPGTKAAEMQNQVENSVKTRRAAQMKAAMKKCQHKYLRGQVGKTVKVLFEGRIGVWEGYTENYTLVRVESKENLRGKLLTVKIRAVEGEHCVGDLLTNLDLSEG